MTDDEKVLWIGAYLISLWKDGGSGSSFDHAINAERAVTQFRDSQNDLGGDDDGDE